MTSYRETSLVTFRSINDSDKPWLVKLMTSEWGSPIIISRLKSHNTLELPAIVAEANGEILGVVTYSIHNKDCEIITLNSLKEGIGVGSQLINKVKEVAKQKSCLRLWTITTNDNVEALEFYKRRGFTVVKTYPNAVAESRKLKSEIPEIGTNGIPIRDEIELEIHLS